MKIIYIHGLGGAKNTSQTYIELNKVFGKEHIVLAPEVPHNPLEASMWIKDYLNKEKPDILLASSMGGFILLSSLYDCKMIVINPAIGGFDDMINAFGMGYQGEFDLGRSNGELKFTLDNKYYDDLKVVTNTYHNKLLNNEIKRKYPIYGIFSFEDEFFHHSKEFKKYYGDNYKMIHDSHSISINSINEYVVPIVKELLEQ